MNGVATIRDLEGRLASAPASPLFARLAHALLAHGEISRAEFLCQRGLELYPHYATGRLVYARCLAARGRWTAALAELAAAADGYPGNIVLAGLEDEWRALEGGAPAQVADDGAVFVDLPAAGPAEKPVEATPEGDLAVVEVLPVAEVVPVVEEAPVVESVPDVDPPPAVATGPSAEAASSIEPVPSVETSPAPAPPAGPMDGIEAFRGHSGTIFSDGAAPPLPDSIADGAPMPTTILPPVPAPYHRASFIEADRIVSRTLAEIYARQGAIQEAVETYRLLLQRMPGLREPLAERLRELEERLRTDPGPRPPREE